MTPPADNAAADRARSDLVELLLPSGAAILARRPPAELLGSLGKLLEIAAIARGEEFPGDLATSDQGCREFACAMRALLEYCFAKPRISLEASGADEILPRDIPWEDVMFVVQWALTEPAFHPQRGS